jgi:glycosyltransferase involved in cell wall biosynthesis
VKVLHLDTGNEWRGGQQQVLYLTQGLEEMGVTSVVATPQASPLAKALRRRDLPVIEIPYVAAYAPKTVRSMQRILADRRWDLLHAHTSHGHTLAFLSFRLPPPRSFQRPALVVSRRVDFVPSSDPLTRLKYTTTDQFFVCVSEAVRLVLDDYGVPERSLYVVRSGVALPPRPARPPGDPRRCALREALGVPDDAFLLGAIGQFVRHKGHRFLIEAMGRVKKQVPHSHLVLLGDGELEKDLRKLADHIGINGNLTFAGYRPRASRYLPALDLFVHCSIEEGLGTSLLDAGAHSVPVVASRAGGIPEVVEHEVTGLLVEPGKAEELASAIVRLAEDDGLRRRMGEAGRRRVAECFTDRRMVEETFAAYRDILGKM